LKDFARQAGLDVVYSEVNRERDPSGGGKGYVHNNPHGLPVLTACSYVEYETATDLATAVEKLDNSVFKGSTVHCISDVRRSIPHQRTQVPVMHISHTYSALQPQSEIPRPREQRYRSRSPGYRGGGGRGYGAPPPADDYYYDRRGPPRGYSPRRDDYRRRTPPPRGYYDDPRDDRYPPGPPRGRGPPPDDYPPPPRGGYRAPVEDYRGPPPPRGYAEPDPYANGHGRDPYGRPPSPGPRRDYGGGDRGYGGGRYW